MRKVEKLESRVVRVEDRSERIEKDIERIISNTEKLQSLHIQLKDEISLVGKEVSNLRGTLYSAVVIVAIFNILHVLGIF